MLIIEPAHGRKPANASAALADFNNDLEHKAVNASIAGRLVRRDIINKAHIDRVAIKFGSSTIIAKRDGLREWVEL